MMLAAAPAQIGFWLLLVLVFLETAPRAGLVAIFCTLSMLTGGLALLARRLLVLAPDDPRLARVRAAVTPCAILAGSRPLAGDTVAVVEVAPNVYRLQVPEYRMAGAARDATHPRPIAEASAAGRSPSHASPASTLSAPWMRTAESMPSRPAEEARSRVAPAGRLRPVSYKRDAHAPAQMRVMVTNGMGREGWAARHAGLLGAMGMTPARITNHRHYGVERTLIRYREGLLPEAERIIGAVATLENAELVADDSLPAGIDLQVILGKDSQPVRHGPTT